ncbi:MAG: 3-deoxy-7-phosphoheptulonate synthase, partial [Steroidobacteraceae bacterium]
MHTQTDDLRIRGMTELATPEELVHERPCTDRAAATVNGSRKAVQRILHGGDDRLVVVIGPCSIHDVKAAREYAQRLARERARLQGALEV